MKTLITCLFAATMMFALQLNAQTSISLTHTWLGTVEGDEQNWDNPRNWSQGMVPSDIDVVVIPLLRRKDGAKYPVIDTEVQVGSLQVHPRAGVMIVSTGTMVINASLDACEFTRKSVENHGSILFRVDPILMDDDLKIE